MKQYWISGVILASVAALVFAEDPASQPSRRPAERLNRERLRDFIEGGPRAEGQFKRLQFPELTEEELQEGIKFVQQNAPQRYRFYEQLPDAGPARKRLAQAWGMRFRTLSRMRVEDSKLAEILEKQFQVQDQAFGLLREAKAGSADDELKEKLQAKVAELVDLSLQEREKRIESLRQKLQKESERLETDKLERDQLIQRQLQRMRNEFQEMNRGRMPERPLDGQRRGDAETELDPTLGLLGDVPGLLTIETKNDER